MWAARTGNEPCLRALIEANANLEAADEDGDTALMIAARDARRRFERALHPVCGASAPQDHTRPVAAPAAPNDP